MKILFTNQTDYDLTACDYYIKKAIKKDKVKGFLSVIYVSKDEIIRINATYRNIDKETDVISFAVHDSEIAQGAELEYGDIFICYDIAVEQAKQYGHSIAREVTFLAVHGYLHLLGYDHMNPEDEKIMIEKQEEILQRIKLRRG